MCAKLKSSCVFYKYHGYKRLFIFFRKYRQFSVYKIHDKLLEEFVMLSFLSFMDGIKKI